MGISHAPPSDELHSLGPTGRGHDRGNDYTTTAGTTTAAEQGASIEDIPPECIAVISELLTTFEPAVKDVDWERGTIDDHLQVMVALASASIGDTTGCENVELDLTEEEGAAPA